MGTRRFTTTPGESPTMTSLGLSARTEVDPIQGYERLMLHDNVPGIFDHLMKGTLLRYIEKDGRYMVYAEISTFFRE